MLYQLAIFELVPGLIQLLLASIALFFIFKRWKKAHGKGLLIAAITTGFILPSIVSTFGYLFFLIATHNDPYGFGFGFQGLQWIFEFIFLSKSILLPLSMAFMLAYVIRASKATDRHHESDYGVVTREYTTPVATWKTSLDSQSRLNILRKREWAFLIDILPSIGMNILLFYLYMHLFSGYSAGPGGLTFVVLICFITILLIIYIPLKDMVNGVSIGKRFTGCRVVRIRDGAPIGIGESIVRNIWFLFPLFALVELAVVSQRSDRKRLGDLLAQTVVVTGEPDFINGIEQVEKENNSRDEPKKPHPLDD